MELYIHPQYAFMAWCSVKRSTGTTLPLPFAISMNFYTYMKRVSIEWLFFFIYFDIHSPPCSIEFNAWSYTTTTTPPIRRHDMVLD
jgi:hypothetical protein